ncbi:MAG: DNA polymerase III subunit delta [Muribaculaceae bacterium]|nr:DNA polymerase III subunit delta [Muribaculaceae bacterium]
MAQSAPTFEGIMKSLKQKNYAPVYFLHGEEGYFTDALAKEFENILPEEEKAFNQYVLYAPEVEPSQIIDVCHRMPMMSDYQVVIVKEAQAVRADKLAKLAPYFKNPVSTTILAVCYRGAQAKGKELMSSLKEGGAVVLESPKIRDHNMPAYISSYVRQKGLSADQKSLEMLRDFIGLDLSRVYNEIDKLAGLLPPNAAITPDVIERNIGISKDYNSYELLDAFATKDGKKVFNCLAYFKSNPKAAPLLMVVGTVFNYFADLLIAHYTPDRSDHGLLEALKLRNPFFLRRIRQGLVNYNAIQVVEILSTIRVFDAKSKGVGSRQNEHQLFHELAFHILTAPGRL